MKNILIILSLLFLSACGASYQQSSGIENTQFIVLVSDSLVGKNISIGEIKNYNITKADLVPYELDVPGAADKPLENSEILKIKVNQGMNKLILKDSGKAVFSKEIYITSGQTRTINIKG